MGGEGGEGGEGGDGEGKGVTGQGGELSAMLYYNADYVFYINMH